MRAALPATPSASTPVAVGRKSLSEGVVGNARLTSLAGLVLLLLFFLEGLTLMGVRQMISIHIFLGLLIIPPLGLKLASTGYRFVRYYTGNAAYRHFGPPALPLRLLAPVLVASVAGLMGSGVMLLVLGPGAGHAWRQIHTLTFVIWFCVMTVHVLAYSFKAVDIAWPDLVRGGSWRISGTVTRQSLVVGSVLLGLALAIGALPLDSAWLHLVGHFHDH
jgi:hypothetical protein